MDLDAQFPMVGRLVLAAVLGMVIGIEREYRGYPAGIRTVALVCVGSALFSEVSPLFRGDAGRVAAQVVSGIGFVGAGVIVHEGPSVRGITTAATIWTSASIGIAIATQLYLVAIVTCGLVVFLLEASPITKHVAQWGRDRRDGRANDQTE